MATKGKFFFLDHNPLKRSTRLVEADLHNPVRLKVVKKEIPMAQSLYYLKGTGTVVLYCHEVKTRLLKLQTLKTELNLKRLV